MYMVNIGKTQSGIRSRLIDPIIGRLGSESKDKVAGKETHHEEFDYRN